MRDYEIVYIFDSELDEEKINEKLERYHRLLTGTDGGEVTAVENFSLEVKMNTHADMNLKLGFGDMNDTWNVSVYGRNLLEPIPSYNVEYDIAPNPLRTGGLSASMLMSYGVQMQYNYR